jgi:hypothetical protein
VVAQNLASRTEVEVLIPVEDPAAADDPSTTRRSAATRSSTGRGDSRPWGLWERMVELGNGWSARAMGGRAGE